MTTAREREKRYRASERDMLRTLRYHLKHRSYVEATRQLAWVLQQATAADAWASVAKDETIAKIQKVQRSAPTKGVAR